MKNKKLMYPLLVVPYQKKPLRDRAYPYVVACAIALLIILVIMQICAKSAG